MREQIGSVSMTVGEGKSRRVSTEAPSGGQRFDALVGGVETFINDDDAAQLRTARRRWHAAGIRSI